MAEESHWGVCYLQMNQMSQKNSGLQEKDPINDWGFRVSRRYLYLLMRPKEHLPFAFAVEWLPERKSEQENPPLQTLVSAVVLVVDGIAN